MMSRTTSKILIAIFIIASLAMTVAVYYYYQQPLESVKTTTLATYVQTGKYDYVANLNPNIIYNSTTLGPNDGKLYEPILTSINCTFNYSFSSSPSAANQSIEYYIQTFLETAKWNKTLTALEAQEWLMIQSDGLNFTFFINTSMIQDLFAVIDAETGSSGQTFSIRIRPVIFQTATIVGERVTEVFTPQLTIRLLTDAGRYVSLEPLTTTKSGSITDTQVIKQTWVENMRMAAIIGLVVSVIGFVAALVLYSKASRTGGAYPVDKAMGSIKDLMIETTQVPDTKTTIEINSIEDLSKTAEILARPISHVTTTTGHVFFILDGETKYQFKISN